MQLISFYELCIMESPFEVRCEYGTLLNGQWHLTEFKVARGDWVGKVQYDQSA